MDKSTTPEPTRIHSQNAEHKTFISKQKILRLVSRINFTGVSYPAIVSDDVADTPSFLKTLFDTVISEIAELHPTESSPKTLLAKASIDSWNSPTIPSYILESFPFPDIRLPPSSRLSGSNGPRDSTRILADNALDCPEIPPEEEAALWARSKQILDRLTPGSNARRSGNKVSENELPIVGNQSENEGSS